MCGPSADERPRFVKVVRTGIARFLGSSEVRYEKARAEDLIPGLRAKLVEEAVEYLLDPSIGELADVYEVVRALAIHDLGVDFHAVQSEASAKTAERGAFGEGMAMYVFTTAPARHEGRHAA